MTTAWKPETGNQEYPVYNYVVSDVDILMKYMGTLKSLTVFDDFEPLIAVIRMWPVDNVDVVAAPVM